MSCWCAHFACMPVLTSLIDLTKAMNVEYVIFVVSAPTQAFLILSVSRPVDVDTLFVCDRNMLQLHVDRKSDERKEGLVNSIA